MKKSLTIVPNKMPAVASEAWPTQRQIRKIAEDLDDVSEYSDELCDAAALLQKMDAARIPEKDFKNAKRTIEGYSKHGYKERIKELNDKWHKVNPRHWYAEDDDEQLNVAAVSSLLANFMGSFPTANIPNPHVFTRQLLEDVVDLDPCFPAVESACRTLRQSRKFMPAICEVVEAIEAEKEAWDRRQTALVYIEEEHADAAELLDAALKRREAEQKRREAEQKRRDEISAARALPISVGDRVRHPEGGNGTVAEIFPLEGLEERPECIVDFDKHGKHGVFVAASLERLAKCEEADAVPGEGNADNGVSRT